MILKKNACQICGTSQEARSLDWVNDIWVCRSCLAILHLQECRVTNPVTGEIDASRLSQHDRDVLEIRGFIRHPWENHFYLTEKGQKPLFRGDGA